MLAQDAIDRRCRKTKTLEAPCRRRIAETGQRGGEPVKGSGTARRFIFLERRNRLGRRIAFDALANQFSEETPITDGLAFALDVEPRVETIVDEPFALRPFNRLANCIIVEALALEPLPELSFRQTLARQQRERRTIGPLVTLSRACPELVEGNAITRRR